MTTSTMAPVLNQERMLKILEREGIDLLVGASPANAFYLTGFEGLFQWLLRDQTGIVSLPVGVLRNDGERTLIIPAIDGDRAVTSRPPVDRIIPTGSMTLTTGDRDAWGREEKELASLVLAGKPERSFPDVLDELVAGCKRIAVDDVEMRLNLAGQLSREITDARPLFAESRLIKTREEVRRLSRAVEITERALSRSMEELEEGITEQEIAQLFEVEIAAGGGRPYSTSLGFGRFSGHPTRLPGENRLREGDLIRWDVGCEYQGYVSDIARTAVYGRASAEQRRRWEAVLAGQLGALEAVNPGTPTRHVYETAMRCAREAGLPHIQRKHVGHGIGISLYEAPSLAPESEEILQEGMVLEVEVPYYELGFGGLSVEDTVEITAGGYVRHTRLAQSLFEVGA